MIATAYGIFEIKLRMRRSIYEGSIVGRWIWNKDIGRVSV